MENEYKNRILDNVKGIPKDNNPRIPLDKVIKLISETKENTIRDMFPINIKCPCCKNKVIITNEKLDMKLDEVVFSNEEIIEFKEIKDDRGIDYDMSEFDTLRPLINTDTMALAVLFLKCYDYLNNNHYLFVSETKDYSKKLIKYLSSMDVSYLRIKIEEYNSNVSFGKTDLLINIRNYTESNRQRMIELISIFFKVFGEEDEM